jgi:O-antigen/teichoic acid export membrane protein
VFNVLFVGYSLAKNNLNNTYQYNMISKKFSKAMNYLLLLINNYINKIQSESFFVPVSIVIVICITRPETARLRA